MQVATGDRLPSGSRATAPDSSAPTVKPPRFESAERAIDRRPRRVRRLARGRIARRRVRYPRNRARDGLCRRPRSRYADRHRRPRDASRGTAQRLDRPRPRRRVAVGRDDPRGIDAPGLVGELRPPRRVGQFGRGVLRPRPVRRVLQRRQPLLAAPRPVLRPVGIAARDRSTRPRPDVRRTRRRTPGRVDGRGTTENTHYRTGFDPTRDEPATAVERIFPIAATGERFVLTVAGFGTVLVRIVEGRRTGRE